LDYFFNRIVFYQINSAAAEAAAPSFLIVNFGFLSTTLPNNRVLYSLPRNLAKTFVGFIHQHPNLFKSCCLKPNMP
jgi:hypothetical protein